MISSIGNVLESDFVKRLLRTVSSCGITVKILKDINLMEERTEEEE